MRLHCLQHVPYEGPAFIGDWAARRGFPVSTHRLYEGDALPDLADLDWLVVMGGPMSVADVDRYPWLAAEKALIRSAVDAGKTVLGICLGAQLIADVMGAPITANPHKEIGWYPVSTEPGGALSRLLGRSFDAFHWHGETFAVPVGARREARSDVCLNQAFSIGGRVIGLQFHLEATFESASELAANSTDELAAGGEFVQDAEAMLSDPGRFARSNVMMSRLLDALEAGELGQGLTAV